MHINYQEKTAQNNQLNRVNKIEHSQIKSKPSIQIQNESIDEIVIPQYQAQQIITKQLSNRLSSLEKSDNTEQISSKSLTIDKTDETQTYASLFVELVRQSFPKFTIERMGVNFQGIELDLSNLQITQTKFECFINNLHTNDLSNVRKLNLLSNKIQEFKFKHLKNLIEWCPLLRQINLSNNPIAISKRLITYAERQKDEGQTMDLSQLTDEILDNFPLRQDICLDRLQIVKGNRHYKSNDLIQIILDRYTQIDEVCFDFGEDCVSCVDKQEIHDQCEDLFLNLHDLCTDEGKSVNKHRKIQSRKVSDKNYLTALFGGSVFPRRMPISFINKRRIQRHLRSLSSFLSKSDRSCLNDDKTWQNSIHSFNETSKYSSLNKTFRQSLLKTLSINKTQLSMTFDLIKYKQRKRLDSQQDHSKLRNRLSRRDQQSFIGKSAQSSIMNEISRNEATNTHILSFYRLEQMRMNRMGSENNVCKNRYPQKNHQQLATFNCQDQFMREFHQYSDGSANISLQQVCQDESDNNFLQQDWKSRILSSLFISLNNGSLTFNPVERNQINKIANRPLPLELQQGQNETEKQQDPTKNDNDQPQKEKCIQMLMKVYQQFLLRQQNLSEQIISQEESCKGVQVNQSQSQVSQILSDLLWNNSTQIEPTYIWDTPGEMQKMLQTQDFLDQMIQPVQCPWGPQPQFEYNQFMFPAPAAILQLDQIENNYIYLTNLDFKLQHSFSLPNQLDWEQTMDSPDSSNMGVLGVIDQTFRDKTLDTMTNQEQTQSIMKMSMSMLKPNISHMRDLSKANTTLTEATMSKAESSGQLVLLFMFEKAKKAYRRTLKILQILFEEESLSNGMKKQKIDRINQQELEKLQSVLFPEFFGENDLKRQAKYFKVIFKHKMDSFLQFNARLYDLVLLREVIWTVIKQNQGKSNEQMVKKIQDHIWRASWNPKQLMLSYTNYETQLLLSQFAAFMFQKFTHFESKEKFYKTYKNELLDLVEQIYLFNFERYCDFIIPKSNHVEYCLMERSIGQSDFVQFESLADMKVKLFVDNLRMNQCNQKNYMSNCPKNALLKKMFDLTMFQFGQSLRPSYDKVCSMEFSMKTIYRMGWEKMELELIDMFLRYLFHYFQFMHQIISQLSEPNNTSLEMTYNCMRFILIYLILTQGEQYTYLIEQEILEVYGEDTYLNFIKSKEKNIRWKEIAKKTDQAKHMSFSKLNHYRVKIDDPNQKSPNVVKMKELQEIGKKEKTEDKQLLNYLDRLKIQNNNQKYIKNYAQIQKLNNPHDPFMRPLPILNQAALINDLRMTYNFIFQVASDQYLNRKNIQKTFRKQLKKIFGSEILKFEHFLSNKEFDHSKGPSNDNNQQFIQRVEKFETQWKIILVEHIKMFNMISLLGMYSFWVQQQNDKIKRARGKAIRRKQPTDIYEVLKVLDLFYIYKAERLNTAYLKRNGRQLKEVHEVFRKYSRYTGCTTGFFKQIGKLSENKDIEQITKKLKLPCKIKCAQSENKSKNYMEKLKLVNFSIRIPNGKTSYSWPFEIQEIEENELTEAMVQLHADRLSIFKFNEAWGMLKTVENKLMERENAVDDVTTPIFCDKLWQKLLFAEYSYRLKDGKRGRTNFLMSTNTRTTTTWHTGSTGKK